MGIIYYVQTYMCEQFILSLAKDETSGLYRFVDVTHGSLLYNQFFTIEQAEHWLYGQYGWSVSKG